jgi:hypothetical protein
MPWKTSVDVLKKIAGDAVGGMDITNGAAPLPIHYKDIVYFRRFKASMQQRKRMSAITLIVMGLGIGLFLKNVKLGLVIGLVLGLLAGGLLSSRK